MLDIDLTEHLQLEPTPHIVFEGDQDIYNRLNDRWKCDQDMQYHSDRRVDIPIQDDQAVEYIESVLYSAYKLFKPLLQEHYPAWEADEEIFETKKLFSTNLANDKTFSPRGWHLDTGEKIIIGLWYFAHPNDNAGGNLQIFSGRALDTKQIDYSPNTFVLMPNLTTAWHRVTKRQPTKLNRRFVNTVLYQPDLKFHEYSRNVDGSDSFRKVNKLK